MQRCCILIYYSNLNSFVYSNTIYLIYLSNTKPFESRNSAIKRMLSNMYIQCNAFFVAVFVT